MSDLNPDFYRRSHDKHFHQVIALHEIAQPHWDLLSEQAPLLPRGWFELSRLPQEDRVEFSKAYWLSKLPLVPPRAVDLEERVQRFFERVEDVGIFLSQDRPGLAFDVHMIYSVEGDFFFHGNCPASKESIALVQKQFPEVRFPADYLAFLEIHDGFSKYTDTGLISTRQMPRTYLRFQEVLSEEMVLNDEDEVVDPKSLIPFYESSMLHAYQCFYSQWYPYNEMGNVCYMPLEPFISSSGLIENHLETHLSFPSFLSWFLFYLEDL